MSLSSIIFWSRISPESLFTAKIPPGLKRPFCKISSSSTGYIPVSEATVIMPFFKIWYLEGLSPFLSRTHIAHSPSDMTIPAGPSQASICIELYSWKALTSGSMVWIFCHAGGKTILIDLKKFIPPFTKSSIMLSREDESEPVSFTNDLKSPMPGIRGVENLDARAFTQFLFPLIALISPLWASNLKGCAKCHLGWVFVENLWWKRQIFAVNDFLSMSK